MALPPINAIVGAVNLIKPLFANKATRQIAQSGCRTGAATTMAAGAAAGGYLDNEYQIGALVLELFKQLLQAATA